MKGLKNKVKMGLVGLALAGTTVFNPLSAQENYTPKYNTIAHKMNRIGNNLKPKTLDKYIDNSKNYIQRKDKYTREDIKNISKNIISDIKKNPPETKTPKDLCYRNSLIYLAIGEANNLPFYGVMTIDHIFVRYDPKRDGNNPLNKNDLRNKGDINIETVVGMIEDEEKFSNQHLIFFNYLSKEHLKKNLLLKNLNEKQLLSYAHAQNAAKYELEEKFGEAIKDCNKAIELNPKCFLAYELKGIALSHKDSKIKDYGKAISIFNKSLELAPRPDIYYWKGMALKNSGKDKEAIESFTKAIDILEKWNRSLRTPNEINQTIYAMLKSGQVYEGILKSLKDCFSGRASAYKNIGDFANHKSDSLESKIIIRDLINLYY